MHAPRRSLSTLVDLYLEDLYSRALARKLASRSTLEKVGAQRATGCHFSHAPVHRVIILDASVRLVKCRHKSESTLY